MKFTLTGISTRRQPTYHEWVEAGASIATVRRCSHFWLGDWVNIGEAAFGEKYAQALEESDFDYHTLVNDAYVCRSVPPDVRRDDLSFGHHVVVAPLEHKEQRRVLAAAAKSEMSIADLRRAVKALQGKPPTVVSAETSISLAIRHTERALAVMETPEAVVKELKDAHMHLTRASLALARPPAPEENRP